MTQGALQIISPGTSATIQDAGRPGLRHLGVPGAGFADPLSAQIANWIVGNAPGAALIEVAMGGLKFEATAPVRIALSGAQLQARLNTALLAPLIAHDLVPGDIVDLGRVMAGVRSYVAVAGGLDGPVHFGSRASYPLAALGHAPLGAGDTLNILSDAGAPRALPHGFAPVLSDHIVLRVRPAPEYFTLDQASQRRLFIRPFRAGRNTDRMGARLEGGELHRNKKTGITSAPLLPGTLQVPPDGQPILSLVDSHCTGGYGRAVQVIAPDRWLMGQIGPGTTLSFARAFADDVPDIAARQRATWAGLIPDIAL